MKIRGEEHCDLCVGIDLGTTNSVLATVNVKPNGDLVSKVVEIPRAVDLYSTLTAKARLSTQKRPTLPSCVYYREEADFEPLVGDFAKIQYPLRPHLVVRSVKSQMGRPCVEGLSPDVPDRTPAQVSARIVRHLLAHTEKIYRCRIDDAVITVPASFDPAMCRATRDAAELAGLCVRNADGSERPILLPEPNAVIYDLINQIRNGEISSRIIDLSRPRNVMVFDFGGGTLDITMHEIRRREDCPEVLKVEEIAANRYTLLGGDDFDEALAQRMFDRYVGQYQRHGEVVHLLLRERETILPQMRTYAEQLKMDVNERYGDGYDSGSGWDDGEEEGFPVGGNMRGTGYAYDDSFSREEIEEILAPFLGRDLVYGDYRRLKEIEKEGRTRNIIYPILDVLEKSRRKLEREPEVDAVIVNGGMSKFYMVTDRLRDFFGFAPIQALDPDQAVARGAAVYHYYLHKYGSLQEDMRMAGEEPEAARRAGGGIEWGRNILNDSLYLGVKNGAVHELVPTGTRLPYQSGVQTGFRLLPGQNRIAVPIKGRNLDGTYRTIASGNIVFRCRYRKGAYVSFTVHMSSSKVITMRAWTSREEGGGEKLEEGEVAIAVGDGQEKSRKSRILAPEGSTLNARAEVTNLLQLCRNLDRSRANGGLAKRIASAVSCICGAGNPGDFAEPVLEALQETGSQNARLRLFVIARKIGTAWQEGYRKRLAAQCMAQIGPLLQGMDTVGLQTTTDIQAVYALSICGTPAQMGRLAALHANGRFRQSCLYAHAKTGTQLAWIFEEFCNDQRRALERRGNQLQFSAHALGVALKQDRKGEEPEPAPLWEIAGMLCEAIDSGALTEQVLISCLLALGWICDQRGGGNAVGGDALRRALSCARWSGERYPASWAPRCRRAREVAEKMLTGEMLSGEEEAFLLTKEGILLYNPGGGMV